MFTRKKRPSLVLGREYIDYKDVDLLQKLVTDILAIDFIHHPKTVDLKADPYRLPILFLELGKILLNTLCGGLKGQQAGDSICHFGSAQGFSNLGNIGVD